MSKLYIILNPYAGRGVAGKRRGELEAALRACDTPFTLVETRARGEAIELTYQALDQGYDCIVAAGGDGTINEVVNGIVRSHGRGGAAAALGIVPLGTGSDFIKMLHGVVANDIGGAARRLAVGRTRSVDVGVANGRYFINGVGLGLDAQVAVEAQKINRLKGVAVYLVAVIRALARYQSSSMTVRFDSMELRQPLLFANVANGRCQGGTFWMTPDAQIDDGMLDLCLIEHMRLDTIIRHVPKVMKGTHTNLRQVTMGRTRHISIDCASPVPFATDGEVIATAVRHIDVHILPQALDVIV